MPAPKPDPWVKVYHPRPHARLRLYCFPYAGGGAGVFRSWSALVPASLEIAAIQPPGREDRLREPPFRRLLPLADAVSEALPSDSGRPFAFFGHSMGAAVAFEVARRLARSGGPAPVHLLVSGRNAPRQPDDREPIHALPRDEFYAELRKYQGTPEEVLDHAELMELLEPLLRADFELIETYTYEPDGSRLAIPLAALSGIADADAPPVKAEPWAEETAGPFRAHVLPGGHFFLNEQRAETLALLNRELAVHLA